MHLDTRRRDHSIAISSRQSPLKLVSITYGQDFISVFNSIYVKGHNFTEPVLLRLVNTYCKPHLLYGAEVVNWTSSELSRMNYAYNSALCICIRLVLTHLMLSMLTQICVVFNLKLNYGLIHS